MSHRKRSRIELKLIELHDNPLVRDCIHFFTMIGGIFAFLVDFIAPGMLGADGNFTWISVVWMLLGGVFIVNIWDIRPPWR